MRLFWLCAFPVGVEVDAGAYEELESRIWLPDRAVVEGQRPERLPLDLLEEVHLPFDRLAIAYVVDGVGAAQQAMTLAVDYAGPGDVLGYNPEFLLDALNVLKTETVPFEWEGKTSPGKLTEGGYTYVVMPVSLD